MNLAEQLLNKRKQFLAEAPAEVANAMQSATSDLRATEIEKNALKTGDTIEDLTLTDDNGISFRISEKLANGPVVMSFFRGDW